MKIHLVNLRTEAYTNMHTLHRIAQPQLHQLVDDPAAADIILLAGNFSDYGGGVLDNPIVHKYLDKCFIYFDSDGFVPLLRGIYTNAEKRWPDLRRAESQLFIAALNPAIRPLTLPKKYLVSFAGGSTSILRKRLYNLNFQREDILIKNTSDYYHWDLTQGGREGRQQEYVELIAASHFGLCPRGASSGSLRLFEVMEMGVAPVLVSRTFALPKGPDWDTFLIQIPESKIADLPRILDARKPQSEHMGQLARAAWEQWFSPAVGFNRIIEVCTRTQRTARVPERWVKPFWTYMLWKRRFKGSARNVLKNTLLRTLRLAGKKVNYEMNRPE